MQFDFEKPKRLLAIILTTLCFSTAAMADDKTCFNAVQGKVAWDYSGKKTWGPHNIDKLCEGNPTSTEPATCFEDVMQSGVPWKADNEWTWGNAVKLCAGTTDASATIDCYERESRNGLEPDLGVALCVEERRKPSASPSTNSVSTLNPFTFPPKQILLYLDIDEGDYTLISNSDGKHMWGNSRSTSYTTRNQIRIEKQLGTQAYRIFNPHTDYEFQMDGNSLWKFVRASGKVPAGNPKTQFVRLQNVATGNFVDITTSSNQLKSSPEASPTQVWKLAPFEHSWVEDRNEDFDFNLLTKVPFELISFGQSLSMATIPKMDNTPNKRYIRFEKAPYTTPPLGYSYYLIKADSEDRYLSYSSYNAVWVEGKLSNFENHALHWHLEGVPGSEVFHLKNREVLNRNLFVNSDGFLRFTQPIETGFSWNARGLIPGAKFELSGVEEFKMEEDNTCQVVIYTPKTSPTFCPNTLDGHLLYGSREFGGPPTMTLITRTDIMPDKKTLDFKVDLDFNNRVKANWTHNLYTLPEKYNGKKIHRATQFWHKGPNQITHGVLPEAGGELVCNDGPEFVLKARGKESRGSSPYAKYFSVIGDTGGDDISDDRDCGCDSQIRPIQFNVMPICLQDINQSIRLGNRLRREYPQPVIQ